MAPTGIKKAGNVDNGSISPEEAARIRASVASKEQAPSVQAQTQLFGGWRQAADTLGSPFEVERIPLSKLHAMRRDPMLAFGLSFIKTPHIRANWHIEARGPEGANAQIAAHLDHDLREIYGSFVSSYLNSLDYGFQAIAKRFVEKPQIPATFIETNPDTGEQTERPVWDQGNVAAIGWKPFVALPPDIVEPLWAGQGEFNGIQYSTEGATAIAGIQSTRESVDKFTIDLYHSLWVTNERESNFGRLWGYPRLGYAYRYWWSYWFIWAIRDRAFERKGDPSIKVFHPEGSFTDDNGQEINYRDYALSIADRIRSGGAIAMPSEPWEDINGRGTIKKWDLEYVQEAVEFSQFDKPLEDMQVQKLRSLWIPELAFIEGGGGTSSRNVAAELGSSFIESQAVLSQQIAEHINRWVIPQWLAVNYSEYVEQGGNAKLVVQGFADRDLDFTTQVIQLIGQQESGQQELLKLADLEGLLKDAGIPLASFEVQQRRQQQIEEAAAAAQAPATTATAGGTGVTSNSLGFSTYYETSDKIYLSDSTEFVENLPSTKHYEDKAIKGFARQMHNVYNQLLRDEYEQAAVAIEKSTESLQLSGSGERVELAKATDILKKWKDSKRWPGAVQRSKEILKNILKRALRKEIEDIKGGKMPSDESIESWVNTHLENVVPKIANTTREEVQIFVASKLREGVSSKAELAKLVREHFSEFPTWKASRIARTETRDVFNAGTLLAAEESGLKRVQALDALHGDTDADCEDRDGEIFTVAAAWKEDEHPNGTLAWRPVPAELSIGYADIEDAADWNEERVELTINRAATDVARRKILKRVVDAAIRL